MHTNTHTKFLSSFTAIQLFHNSASFHPHRLPPPKKLPSAVRYSTKKSTTLRPSLLNFLLTHFSHQPCWIKLWSAWARDADKKEKQIKQITIQSLNFFFQEPLCYTHFIQALPARRLWFTKTHTVQYKEKCGVADHKNGVVVYYSIQEDDKHCLFFFCFCVFTAATGSKIAWTIKITV